MNLGAENNRFDTGYFKDIDVENGIMGGGGVNVTQTVIGGESEWLTEDNTTKEITLTDDINKYDYLVFVLEFRRGTSTSYENHTVLARVGYTNAIYIDHSIGSDDNNGNYIIKVSIGASDTGAYIYQGARGSAYSGARIKQVIGIKLTKNLDNATSLDETLLYTGTTDIPLDTNGEVPISNLNDYDYVLVKICGVYNSVDATTYSIEKLIKLPDDTVNNFDYAWGSDNTIAFNGWLKTTNNKIAVGLRAKGSSLSTVYIASIIGYKSSSLSTADIAEMAMPSNVYVTISRGTSTTVSTSYIAPANGWICWMDNPSSNTAFMRIECHYSGLYKTGAINVGKCDSDCIISCPVCSGDSVGFYGASLTYNSYSTIRFFYSIGDAKALGLI